MKRSLTGVALGCLALAFVALPAGADFRWYGDADQSRGWFDVGNAANKVDGSWWASNTTPTWTAAPSNATGTIVYFTSGSTCVLSNDISAMDGRLFVSAGVNGTAENTLIVNDGAKIDGLGICVSGPDSWNAGDGHLFINGGDLTLGGGPSGLVYGLQVGYSKRSGAVGTAEINGGKITIDKGSFYLGVNHGSHGEVRVNGGSLESKVGFRVGISSTTKYENQGLYVQTNGAVAISAGTPEVQSGGQMELLGGAFATTNQFLVGNGGTCTVGANGALTAEDGMKVYNDGLFSVTGGTVTAAAACFVTSGGRFCVGPSGTLMANAGVRTYNGGQLAVTGGSFSATFVQTSPIKGTTASSAGLVDLRGGTVSISEDLTAMQGGLVRIAMPLAAADVETLKLDGSAAGYTNTIEIVRGGSVTRSGASGIGYNGAKSVNRLAVTGGAYTNEASMTPKNKMALFEISDGGVFYVAHVNKYGNLAPGGSPYYLRIKGQAEVSAGCFGASTYTGDGFDGQKNIIMEHVIDTNGVAPILTRNSSGGGTQMGGSCVPGNQRLRPEGGVQIVSTNQFALFHALKSSVTAFDTGPNYFTSAPDATLWTTGNQADGYWGSTLNPEAKIALAYVPSGRYVYRSASFAARPMGYCELPKTRKESLRRVSVGLTVAAPPGGTLAGALAKVRAGLETAGYANVETNGVTGLTTFDVPLARIAESNADQKLLLDFTETPMPDDGMKSTPDHYAYPTVTNALFTAVSVAYDKPGQGLIFILR